MTQPSSPTHLREIVTVAIRILVIYSCIESLSFLLKVLAGYRTADLPLRYGILIFAVLAVGTFWLWQLSGYIARFITRGQDSTLDCGSLAHSDLYTFAFLLVGLYFAVASFAPSLSWLYYCLRQGSSDAALSPQQQANFYVLFECLVKLFLGLALIFNGRKFATKIIRHHNETA
jgi:hypothetical protein